MALWRDGVAAVSCGGIVQSVVLLATLRVREMSGGIQDMPNFNRLLHTTRLGTSPALNVVTILKD